MIELSHLYRGERKKVPEPGALAKGTSPGKARQYCSWCWDEVTGEHLFWKELQIREGGKEESLCLPVPLVRTKIFLFNPPSKAEQLSVSRL